MMIVGPVNVSWHMPTPVWQGLHPCYLANDAHSGILLL
jgi:hypothetical protein